MKDTLTPTDIETLLGVIIDVIAIGQDPGATGRPEIVQARGLPPELAEEVGRLTRDLDLPVDWINTTVATAPGTQLPPGFADRIQWRQYGGLSLGLAGRWDLIASKLHAAADSDPRSRHVSDLLALRPTTDELESAAAWVLTQDAGPQFPRILRNVVAYVAARTS